MAGDVDIRPYTEDLKRATELRIVCSDERSQLTRRLPHDGTMCLAGVPDRVRCTSGRAQPV